MWHHLWRLRKKSHSKHLLKNCFWECWRVVKSEKDFLKIVPSIMLLNIFAAWLHLLCLKAKAILLAGNAFSMFSTARLIKCWLGSFFSTLEDFLELKIKSGKNKSFAAVLLSVFLLCLPCRRWELSWHFYHFVGVKLFSHIKYHGTFVFMASHPPLHDVEKMKEKARSFPFVW